MFIADTARRGGIICLNASWPDARGMITLGSGPIMTILRTQPRPRQRFNLRRAFGIGLLFFAASSAHAQYEPGKVTSVLRESFAIREFDEIELPQGSVHAVHVCRRGFLWAGTREGLVQYKSGQQRIWQQSVDDKIGLPSGTINTIYEDDAGNIWVGTARGIAFMPAGGDDFMIVTRSPAQRDLQLDTIAIASLGQDLMAVTAAGEVLRVSSDSVEVLKLREDKTDGHVFPRPGEQAFTAGAADDERLYLGSSTGALFALSIHDNYFDVEELTSTDDAIIQIQANGDDLIWLGRDSGLTSQPRGGKQTQRTRLDPLNQESQGYYRAMSARSTRSAWFAKGPNVVRVRGNKADVVRLPGRGNEVRSITVDRTGNIWIGSYYGLFYALDTQFNTLKTGAAYQSGVITSLASAGERLFIGGQNLWVGDLDGDRFDEFREARDIPGANGFRLDPASLSQDPITALAAGEDLLLAGYYAGGIDVIDLKNGQVNNVISESTTGESLKSAGVTALAQVDEQRWLASFFRFGLAEVEVTKDVGAPKVTLRRLSEHPALIGIYELEKNRFLAVTETQLIIVERDQNGAYALRDFDTSPRGILFAVEPDGVGGAYLGIENVGVRHLPKQMVDRGVYEPQAIQVVENLLARRTVWHLLLDNEDTLWATTNNGVFVFDLPRGKLISHTTYRDGLPSNEFEYGPGASLLAANGEKLFVSSTGPVVFKDPVQANTTQIKLNWTEVTVNGTPILDKLENPRATQSLLRLPFKAVSDGVLKLEYGYDDHVRALDATYAMRFTEDGEWIPGGRPSVSVTGQQDWAPVTAEFAMLDYNGAVISQPLAVRIELSPPWYMIWRIDVRVALPLCIVVGLLLFATQVRAKNRQRIAVAEAARERELVEAEMRGRLSEKEILLREIHHRVGNILSNFAANVRTMQRRASSSETRDTLEHLNARIKVQSAVHMLLQRSDRTDINVANMIRQVTAGARDFFGGEDGSQIICRLDDVYMTYSKAQYLGLIVNELLTNSYKHGPGVTANPHAEITLRMQSDGGAEFHYRDHGEGPGDEDIRTAMETRRYGESGGLGQVVAMARELKGDPVLYRDEGMHISFRLPSRLLRNELEDLALGNRDQA